MIFNLFELLKSFFKISKHNIRAPFLLVGTNMHILNLNIQSWTKGWRQIDKIRQNRFFYGMVYS